MCTLPSKKKYIKKNYVYSFCYISDQTCESRLGITKPVYLLSYRSTETDDIKVKSWV